MSGTALMQAPKPALSVAGKWTMTLETPHGKISAAFDLKVDGKKVTGTFKSDHGGEVAVVGEYAEGKLTFKATEGDLTVSARVKDADTLTVVLSTERGDLTGDAMRVKK